MKVFISSGEVSGDLIGGYLATALKQCRPKVEISGAGGSRMAAAGVSILFDTNHLGSVGITEPLTVIPDHLKLFGRIRRQAYEQRPDVVILIGNDFFHILLGRWLKSKGIRTISYFPPQVWIWNSLAKKIACSFDVILASFPEEASVYRSAGAKVHWVGHYLVDVIQQITPERKREAKSRCGLPESSPAIGLLPGSRHHELHHLAPVLLDAAARMKQQDERLRFVLPLAEPVFEKWMRKEIALRGLTSDVVVNHNSWEAMSCCDLVLMSSGTASLEATLMGIPMIILYRVSPISMIGIRLVIKLGLIKSETVGLPNLLAGRAVVPELRQSRAKPAPLAEQALGLLNHASRRLEMVQELTSVAAILGESGCLKRAAEVIVSEIEGYAKAPPEPSAECRARVLAE